MRLHNVYLLVRNDGEEYEVYDSEKDAKDRLVLSIYRENSKEDDSCII